MPNGCDVGDLMMMMMIMMMVMMVVIMIMMIMIMMIMIMMIIIMMIINNDDTKKFEAGESLSYYSLPIYMFAFFEFIRHFMCKIKAPIDAWLFDFDVTILKDQKNSAFVSRWANTRSHDKERYHSYTLNSEQLEPENGQPEREILSMFKFHFSFQYHVW